MGNMAVSVIRTVAPAVAGGLITWAVRQGWTVDASVAQPLTEGLTVAFTLVWYWAVRQAEKRWPGAGYLLGVPRPPSYGQAPPAARTAP